MRQNGGFKQQSITRHDGPLETGLIGPRQVVQVTLSRTVLSRLKCKDSCYLRHGFNEKNARHNGVVREMTLKKRFANTYVFVPSNIFSRMDFCHPINE
jgi:hypothetical protein